MVTGVVIPSINCPEPKRKTRHELSCERELVLPRDAGNECRPPSLYLPGRISITHRPRHAWLAGCQLPCFEESAPAWGGSPAFAPSRRRGGGGIPHPNGDDALRGDGGVASSAPRRHRLPGGRLLPPSGRCSPRSRPCPPPRLASPA